ncbi:threonine aldolase family protein [Aciditerrimonas ferrireducens]|uniref:Threonine aldolase family protein n=1 Tax=Aciditerrimonas ferrireducens TaxID=667306 RepID=A0ABV6C1S1_9ACTN|nr:GntG family PLP-dependent aldolase [Aciditerrimonas ferrireducens]MCK4177840.1 beta-eliminating lyase-related protein [Aciditerrimonas ferrireducens]
MADGLVDLRSDTVTKPTPAMRRAMAEAEVGDDGWGEDPTVRRLEERVAELLGKEAALFVPSGTMANQLALGVLGRPGARVVLGGRQHVLAHEAGGAAAWWGLQLHPVADPHGILDPGELAWALAAELHHWPPVALVAVENSHAAACGAIWDPGDLARLGAVCRGVPIHLDGARLWNAQVASGVSAAELAAVATTVATCLSKGLCAPAGSLLAGPADLVAEARELRHRMGGGMRQVGVLAAAGLVALEQMVERLAEDHRRARRLAAAAAECFGDPTGELAAAPTNMVLFEPPDPEAVLRTLQEEGVLASSVGPGVLRLVTHHDVDDEGIERALRALGQAARSGPGARGGQR